MLAKLADFLLQFLDLFKFMVVVKAWEVGVVLRLGRYSRTLQPGPHLVWPLAIEQVATEWSVPIVRPLAPQSLTTLDGKNVVVSGVLTYRCVDAQKMTCEVGGHETVVQDSATGVIAQHVTRATWKDLGSDAFLRAVTRAVNRQARRWGLAVDRVQFSDIAQCQTIRLVGRGVERAIEASVQ